MKTQIQKSLLMVLVSFFSDLAAQSFPNVSLFATGSSTAGASVLNYNAPDNNWTASVTGSLGTFVPARLCGNAYSGWATSPWLNGAWISFPHTCNLSDIADHTCLGSNLTVWYKLLVNLPTCASYTATNAYCLTIHYFADNAIECIKVNGVANYITTNPNPYGAMEFSNMNTVTLSNGWQSGTNTVLVQVDSEPGAPISWEALLANFTATINYVYGLPALYVPVHASSLLHALAAMLHLLLRVASRIPGNPADNWEPQCRQLLHPTLFIL